MTGIKIKLPPADHMLLRMRARRYGYNTVKQLIAAMVESERQLVNELAESAKFNQTKTDAQ